MTVCEMIESKKIVTPSQMQTPMVIGQAFARRLLRILKFTFQYYKQLDTIAFGRFIVPLERFVSQTKDAYFSIDFDERVQIFRWVFFFWIGGGYWTQEDLNILNLFCQKYSAEEFKQQIYHEYDENPDHSIQYRQELIFIGRKNRSNLKGDFPSTHFRVVKNNQCPFCKKKMESASMRKHFSRKNPSKCILGRHCTTLMQFPCDLSSPPLRRMDSYNIETYPGAFKGRRNFGSHEQTPTKSIKLINLRL